MIPDVPSLARFVAAAMTWDAVRIIGVGLLELGHSFLQEIDKAAFDTIFTRII